MDPIANRHAGGASTLKLDLDLRMDQLEGDWRRAYEASLAARADCQSLAEQGVADTRLLDLARKRLDRAEAQKARVMTQIERLEREILGRD